MQGDSTLKTLITAGLLCVVCSILVSTAAVKLRPAQEINKKLDIKKNLLLAAGLIDNPKASPDQITEAFKVVDVKIIDLATGNEVTDVDADSFDQKKRSKDPKTNYMIPGVKDLSKIKMRSQLAKVYHVVKNGQLEMVVFPVHGKGLWSTMYGFLALAPDLTTVKGIGFYEHGETPGLGGEIENPNWKALWKGKKIFNSEGKLALNIVKGAVNPSSTKIQHEIDGLAGATITANGVTALVHYWLGADAFGPYVAKLKSQGGGQ